MKTKNFKWFAVLTAALIVAFSACKKDSPEEKEPTPNPGPSVNMQDIALKGKAFDAAGNPLAGVTVSTGVMTVTTGADGSFTFSRAAVVSGRAVVKFEKKGYFSVTRSGVKANEMNLEVVLRAKGGKNTVSITFNASESKTVEAGGMKATVPANGLVKEDGSAYSGIVNAEMLYLDPNDADFAEAMPGGDLAAIRDDGSEVQLISWGMSEISFTDNAGNPLQLKEDETSTLTFPIPAGMESNPPATIPLWYFDDEKGIWIEEGIATYNGSVYEGEIKHFSWHNLDVPVERVIIKGKVTDCDGKPVQYVKVTARQIIGFNGYNQGVGITGSNGEYTIYAPANTELELTVLSEDYYNYANPYSEKINPTPGGQTLTKNINLPCKTTDPGNPGEGSSTTEVEELDITYIAQGGTTQRIAFDNGGKRFRFEGDEEGEPLVMIIDSIAKKFYMLMAGEVIDWYATIGAFTGVTWDNPGDFVQFGEMPKQLLQAILLDPANSPDWNLSKAGTQTIIGKNCDVYTGVGIDPETGEEANVKIAKWNGITMLMEVNGEVYLLADSVSLEVPDSLFRP